MRFAWRVGGSRRNMTWHCYSMTIYVLIVLALAGAEAPSQAFAGRSGRAGRAGRPWPPDLVVFNVCCGFALCIHCVNMCKLHILHFRSLQSKIYIFIVYIIFHCHWAALCCTSTPCRWFILGIRRCGEIVVQFISIRFIWLAWCAFWTFDFLSQNWICIDMSFLMVSWTLLSSLSMLQDL